MAQSAKWADRPLDRTHAVPVPSALRNLWEDWGYGGTQRPQDMAAALKGIESIVNSMAQQREPGSHYRLAVATPQVMAATEYGTKTVYLTLQALMDQRLRPLERLAVTSAMAMHESGHARRTPYREAAVAAFGASNTLALGVSNLKEDIALEAETTRLWPAYGPLFRLGTWWITQTYDGQSRGIDRLGRTTEERVSFALSATRYDKYTDWAGGPEVEAERQWWHQWAERAATDHSPEEGLALVREALDRVQAEPEEPEAPQQGQQSASGQPREGDESDPADDEQESGSQGADESDEDEDEDGAGDGEGDEWDEEEDEGSESGDADESESDADGDEGEADEAESEGDDDGEADADADAGSEQDDESGEGEADAEDGDEPEDGDEGEGEAADAEGAPSASYGDVSDFGPDEDEEDASESEYTANYEDVDGASGGDPERGDQPNVDFGKMNTQDYDPNAARDGQMAADRDALTDHLPEHMTDISDRDARRKAQKVQQALDMEAQMESRESVLVQGQNSFGQPMQMRVGIRPVEPMLNYIRDENGRPVRDDHGNYQRTVEYPHMEAEANTSAALRAAFTLRRQTRDNRAVSRSGRLSGGRAYRVRAGFDNVFTRRDAISPDRLDVHLLVDCSGSMKGEKIRQAARLAVNLTAALQGLPYIRTHVWGHNSSGGTTVYDAYDSRKAQPLGAIGLLSAAAGNNDGFAIAALTEKIVRERTSREQSVLVVLSDGAPNDGPASVATAVKRARGKGIGVVSVAVEGGLTEIQEESYGPNAVVTWNNDWGRLGREMAQAIAREA